jgi:molybdopterin adenylyltransferase
MIAKRVRTSSIIINHPSSIINPKGLPMIRVAVVTVSDSCAQGTREDTSGPTIQKMLPRKLFEMGEKRILPDDREVVAAELRRLADGGAVDLILTTGGTGLGPRDVTPEATISVCERMVPGFGEMTRIQGLRMTTNAALSRAVAGIRGRTLIINLPGSAKAVRECLGLILNLLPHAVDMLRGGGHEPKEPCT